MEMLLKETSDFSTVNLKITFYFYHKLFSKSFYFFNYKVLKYISRLQKIYNMIEPPLAIYCFKVNGNFNLSPLTNVQ